MQGRARPHRPSHQARSPERNDDTAGEPQGRTRIIFTRALVTVVVAFLRTASDGIDRLTELVLVPLVVFLVTLVFASVVLRYAFNAPMVTAVELTRLSFNWACFLAATVAVKRGEHVRFTILTAALPPRLLPGLTLLLLVAMAVFFCLMIVQGWWLYDRTKGTVFPALGWSQGLLYLSLPVSGTIMLLHVGSAIASGLADIFGTAGSSGGKAA